MSGGGLSREELQTLFLLTARAWGIPHPEERVQEASAELEVLMGHLRTVMEYPLPPDVEPAPGLSLERLETEHDGKGGVARGGERW